MALPLCTNAQPLSETRLPSLSACDKFLIPGILVYTSLAKDALAFDENGYLRMGPSAAQVRDFQNEPVRCPPVERDSGMSLWPVCGFRRADRWLVVFIAREAVTESSVWQLDDNGTCLAKHVPDAAVMRFLLAWSGCSAPLATVGIAAPSGTLSPEWLAESLAMYTDEGAHAAAATLQPTASVPDWLLGFLQHDLASLNADVQGLLLWLETSPQVAGKAGAIRRVWRQLCGQFLGRLERSTTFFDALRNQAGYQLLREVTAAFIGHHVLRCPFTETYQLASHARHITHKGPQGRPTGGARVIRYDPLPGLCFHEIRGHGFLAQTDALVTGEGLVFQPSLEDALSSWLTPGACAGYPTLSPGGDRSFRKEITPKVLVLNTSAGPNLGHLLWNDCSGLAGVLALSRTLPEGNLVGHWRLALSPTRDLRFARDEHETFIRRVLTRLASSEKGIGGVTRTDPEVMQYFDSEVALSEFLESADTIAISLKSLVMSPDLAESFRAETARVLLPDTLARLAVPVTDILRVFVNVRVHDKALLNIAECLVAAVERARLSGWQAHRLLFVLEGTEEAMAKLDELSRLLVAHGAGAILAVGLGVDALGSVLSHCDVAVAPIGSGAVLPTWIYDLPTFLHADRAHMPQAGFWSQVGGSPDNLVVIETVHIQDVEDRLYSSYVIAPGVFADCFCRLLARRRVQHAARPSAGR